MGQSVTFLFDRSVPMADVEDTLRLAKLAVECLHGEDRVMLEARASVDVRRRLCVIGTFSDVGRTLALLFGGYSRREFGSDRVKLQCGDAEPVETAGSSS